MAGILQGNLLNADLEDVLFKSAAAASSAPMRVTGIDGCQEYYSDLYQQQQSICQQ